MKRIYFNDGITKDSIEQMIACFHPVVKKYDAGEILSMYSNDEHLLAIVLTGSCKLYFITAEGDTRLLEMYEKGDIFGRALCLPLDDLEYTVMADSPCKVMYIDYDHVVTPCEKICAHHSKMISNILMMTAQRAQALSLHISILNQQTTRRKLLAYLQYVAATSGAAKGQEFKIPISLGAMAEYLCVDRSAMMRELRTLKADGILASERRSFRFLPGL